MDSMPWRQGFSATRLHIQRDHPVILVTQVSAWQKNLLNIERLASL